MMLFSRSDSRVTICSSWRCSPLRAGRPDSMLTDPAIEVPQADLDTADIPVTYVPARNLIFLSVAAAHFSSAAVSLAEGGAFFGGVF